MTDIVLKKSPNNPDPNSKILIVVMDGIGMSNTQNSLTSVVTKNEGFVGNSPFLVGNAVNSAWTPNLSSLLKTRLCRQLCAHGPSVGLPSTEDMGNSEVGHNAIGSGRIFAQGAKLVNQAIKTQELFASQTWKWLTDSEQMRSGVNSLHLIGLLSDGNVHSHIDHLFSLIEGAKKSSVKKVRLHLLLDGRDVPPTSALEYVDKLNEFISKQISNDFDCKVASGGGRMFVTMDRYESDWKIVERGYNAHVLGDARSFNNILEAIETFRIESEFVDQHLPPFVISDNKGPVGPMVSGDSVVLFNFRGDRAIQISRALTELDFTPFVRKQFPKIKYAGMMQYDGDLKIPENFLVTPPLIDNSMSELLAKAGVKQFACSETQKYGHVTYFWNGNRSGKFCPDLENYIEIPSDKCPFSERPWMKSAEITDIAIQQMYANSFKVGRINYPNGDMVGHTGDFEAAVISVAALDLQIKRLMDAAKATNTILVITADHGNADEMYELDKKSGKAVYDKKGNIKQKTSHTLAPVPFIIYNDEILPCEINIKNDLENAGLANIAATVLELAGFLAPDIYEPSLINWGEKKN